jgi:hypothetical protein
VSRQKIVRNRVARILSLVAGVCTLWGTVSSALPVEPLTTISSTNRLRVIIETDAGGDPDDEQSLVRFLLYANEWDVEGIIANRPVARDRENLNPERTGLGIVRAQLRAYGKCHSRLAEHDGRYPTEAYLWARTVPGYEDTPDGEQLILHALESPDPRPVWFCNWGTDHGSARSSLSRALDRILRERGAIEYRRLKNRVRLSSADAFGEHTATLQPPWVFWLDTLHPEIGGKRWYHRFSALTARAGGFAVERDVRTGHGPLGALYPANTTHLQKEGDTMTFLYLIPTGMNDVDHPDWGSWAGRYGRKEIGRANNYYWANAPDAWQGTTNRDNTLARWAADLQSDFRARLDWCVHGRTAANHAPTAVVNGTSGKPILGLRVTPGAVVALSAAGSSDPDGNAITYAWWIYSEAGTYRGIAASLEDSGSSTVRLNVPPDLDEKELHVILTVRDDGTPPLVSYRRVVVTGRRDR